MVAKVSTCVHPLVADTAVDKPIFLIRFVPIATPTQLTVATFTPQPAGQKQQQPMKPQRYQTCINKQLRQHDK